MDESHVFKRFASLPIANGFSKPDGISERFDVIVVGSGAGGAMMARKCVEAGKNVLLVERGQADSTNQPRDEKTTLFDRRPYDNRTVEVNGQPQRLYIGGQAGGSTSVYGAALLRPSEEDFHPGRSYGSRMPKNRWDWPIEYDDLAAHYDEAEQLFGVAGSDLGSFDPLKPPCKTLSSSPLPLASINQRLAETSRSAGWNPFRLPLGINGSTCLRCSDCAGFVCPNGSRRSGADVLRERKPGSGVLRVLDNTEIVRLDRRADGKIIGLVARRLGDDQTLLLRARSYVLAAGALGSAAILLRSEIGGDHVGRGYMYHYSPVVVGLFRSPTNADRTFVKQLGFADHYFGTPDCREKTGIIQSLPAPGKLMVKKNARAIPGPLVKSLRRRMLPLVGIVEDLPSPENRIRLKADRITLHHRFRAFDRVRGAALVKQMVRILKTAGAVHCVVRPTVSSEHVAHQCGTTPMADDWKMGVVDRHCRVFHTDNLFVVDGGVLPSSLGVGPALTIMANSLRVAPHVIASC